MGYIKGELSVEEVFDTSLIDRIHPEQEHYKTERKKREE
jgi:hypothetical protein